MNSRKGQQTKRLQQGSILTEAERTTKRMNRSSLICGTIPGGLTYDLCLQRREREAEKKMKKIMDETFPNLMKTMKHRFKKLSLCRINLCDLRVGTSFFATQKAYITRKN